MTATTRTVGNTNRQTIIDHLAELRAALEEQRTFRAEQLAELDADTAARPARAMGERHDEVTGVLRAGATAALSEIEAAAARIEAGTYGACERCKAEIPLERLEILPMAALCMGCARARERRTKLRTPR